MKGNVLLITPTATLSGAESTVKKVALELKRQGLKVHIVVLSKGDNGLWAEFDGEEMFFLNSSREALGFLKSIFLLIWWRISGKRFRYSFTSHIHCNAFVGLARMVKLLQCNESVYRESTIPFDWYKGARLFSFKVMYKFYNHPKVLVCQTNEMKEELIRNCAKPPCGKYQCSS